MEAKPGDYVKVKADKEYQGLLMPSLEMTGKDTLILKLDNGYNIGIKKKKISQVKILKKYKKPEDTNIKLKKDPNLPSVSIISVGGTISSKVDYRTGGVYADYTAKDFVTMCPELQDIANIKAKKAYSMMSEDMLPKDWKAIAKTVNKEIKDGADGVVVTQGTDTLHYTAAALSFMLEKLSVPVIITASQRSIDRGSSDAFMNLICAVKAAAAFEGAEVMTCLHGRSDDDHCLLIRGTKVRKMDTSRRDAFRPINCLPIAKVYVDKEFELISEPFKKRSNVKTMLADHFEEDIALIYIHPNLDPEIFDFYAKKRVKGVVLAATALGHVNTKSDRSIISKLLEYQKKNIPVVVSSQTLYGRVDPYVYSNLREVSIKAGGIYAKDMHPETAFVKLGWVLGQEKNYDKVKKLMLHNHRGEYTERLTSEMFLY